MNKLYRYFLSWIKFRWYYYFVLFRPTGLKINGAIRFDFFSFIEIDKNADIFIGEKVRLKNSRLYFKSSSIVIGAHSQFAGSVVLSDNSSLELGEHAKMKNVQFALHHQSAFKCGTHLLMDGSQNAASGFYAYQSQIEWGSNVNHYAFSKCNQGNWQIGDHVFINKGSQVRCDHSIKMGSYILISYECIIFDTNTHSVADIDRRKEIIQGFPNTTKQNEADNACIKKAPIVIGNDVWVGTRAMIFKGSELGNSVIVGAAAVVSGLRAATGARVVGNPGRIV